MSKKKKVKKPLKTKKEKNSKIKEKVKQKIKEEAEKDYNNKGVSIASNENVYKEMFKKESGKIKIFEVKLSKNKTIKVKIKYDKKKKRIVLLDPFLSKTGRSSGIKYCIDCVSFIRELWDIFRRIRLEQKISKKRKHRMEEILLDELNLEVKFIKAMHEVDFLFNKSKLRKKINEEFSKGKINRKIKKTKKSNR